MEIPLLSATHMASATPDLRATVTFPAHAAAKLYCLATEAHGCDVNNWPRVALDRAAVGI